MCIVLLNIYTSPLLADNQIDNSSQSNVAEQAPKNSSCDCPIQLNRIKEFGAEVVVDGSMKVLEPLYGKDFDLVETTVPVTPSANHVRMYAVQVGTYTVIKALFDDGTSKVITNN